MPRFADEVATTALHHAGANAGMHLNARLGEIAARGEMGMQLRYHIGHLSGCALLKQDGELLTIDPKGARPSGQALHQAGTDTPLDPIPHLGAIVGANRGQVLQMDQGQSQALFTIELALKIDSTAHLLFRRLTRLQTPQQRRQHRHQLRRGRRQGEQCVDGQCAGTPLQG